MSGVKLSIFSKISLIMCGTVLALLGSELLVRVFDVDMRLFRKILFYQTWMPELHRTSSDAQRLFELVPNSSARGAAADANFKDPKYPNKKFDVSINALGFRGKGFAPMKKSGVFRIVIFGGSNTFGMNVSDEDTYPAQMQKIFDEQYPGKVEVWNAGISAYMMSQDVAYAETVIKKFDPNLLILQDTNPGRRAFYANVTIKELRELFDKNNELFTENMPFLWQQNVSATEKARFFLVSLGSKIHSSLFPASALYRAFYVSFCTCLGVFQKNDHSVPISDKYNSLWGNIGNLISVRELNLFTERHKDKKIILFFITDLSHGIGRGGFKIRENMGGFFLNTRDKPPPYREIHPPSYVYAWYARELCNFLAQYIPAGILGGKEAVSVASK